MKPTVYVVTVGPWDERQFDGLLIDEQYIEKGDARRSKNKTVRAAYWRARRAIRNNSYSLEDAPAKAHTGGKLQVWYHDLKSRDV